MTTVYVFDGLSLHKLTTEGGFPQLNPESATSLPPGSFVACSGIGEFYVVEKDSQKVLRLYRQSLTCGEWTLPGPVHQLFVHMHKVYCRGDDCVYVFDPLCADVETLWLGHKVTEVEAACHGFVFVDDKKELYAFHFNQGTRKVDLKGHVTKLLGRYNHSVAVLIDDAKVVFVNEKGDTRDDFILEITVPFVVLEGDALVTFSKECGLSFRTNDSCVALEGFSNKDVQLLVAPSAQCADTCSICFCEFEGEGGITLDCGHPFHRECIAEFSSRANSFIEKGEHIVFTYSVCPSGCGSHIRHAAAPLSTYMNRLYREIHEDAMRLLREVPGKAVEDLLYYVCSRCGKPFFGGERWCSRSLNGEPPKKPCELICSNCNNDFVCPTHGHHFVLYKCRYCCNPATRFSFGNRHMCEDCHGQWENVEPDPGSCRGAEECCLPAGHPTGGSYPIGCMLCMCFDKMSNKLFYPEQRS
ncbi:hypothetical protein ERJ75_001530000 [Trypanosoma vivax]|uniref:RING-type domain-containing protein n=1 Tax=Trypanosoma vivax (strain Y486) TaxID=1055687 RepID=G0UB25_TRYVY|nr:hypothetical protein ERJ75_001530000 [Trypanosoma vivax]CCC53012.1 conserved hypothetical protein [Trypanosoma vivax Y486]